MAVVQIPDGTHGIEKVDIDCHVVTTRDEKGPARSSENQKRKPKKVLEQSTDIR